MKQRSLRQATRRFEMSVHEGVPETPQPMYQESTYGKTPNRMTGQSSAARAPQPDGEVAATYVLRNGEIIVEHPSDRSNKKEQRKAMTGEGLPKKAREVRS